MISPRPAPIGNILSVTAPISNAIAPPGYYLLFVIDKNGVSSLRQDQAHVCYHQLKNCAQIDRLQQPADMGLYPVSCLRSP